jgi:hypothetical protein
MASLKRFSSMFFGFSLLAVGAIVGGACSVKLDTSMGYERSDNDNFAGSVGAGSGGGSEEGVLVPPPNDQSIATSFSDRCGGGCMSGDKSIACALPMNPDNPPDMSCQVVPTQNGPVAECLTPGNFQDGEPCEKASNCAASLGCVRAASDVSVCRPYCCGDIEACAPGSYCTLGAMAEDVLSEQPIQIPVCVPATPCTLLDDTTCPVGRTCTLVRADGTTSCVQPGPGKLGDPCPCSAGHVCSIALGLCLKLCHVGGGDCPDAMLCQGGSEGFPDGTGVCVK